MMVKYKTFFFVKRGKFKNFNSKITSPTNFTSKQIFSNMNIDKLKEAKKGYWTDDEARGISIRVSAIGEDTTRISVSSDYWYRVQHFDVDAASCNSTKAWQVIQTVMKECGRTLIPITTEVTVVNDEDNESTTEEIVEYYNVAYLNTKQVDQLYYVLKHELTTAKYPFVISHTFSFDTSTECVIAPPSVLTDASKTAKNRRRRKRANNKKIEDKI